MTRTSTERLLDAVRAARMGASTIGDYDKIDKAVTLYQQYLLTESEAIEYMG